MSEEMDSILYYIGQYLYVAGLVDERYGTSVVKNAGVVITTVCRNKGRTEDDCYYPRYQDGQQGVLFSP